MVKTNSSKLQTLYNIQQSATQDSNDMTHRLSCRTAATTRISADARHRRRQGFANNPIRWAFISLLHYNSYLQY